LALPDLRRPQSQLRSLPRSRIENGLTPLHDSIKSLRLHAL
jgi:hypothetical protein